MYLLTNNANSNVIVAALLLILGLVLIIKGGDFFVDASVWIAEILHMPKFLIGATIVSLATTLPEMIVSIIAVVEGNFAISIGNAVGSVTANTGLILAISAIFVGGVIDRKEFGIKAMLIMLSGLILFGFCLTGKFGIFPSILLLLILIYYMYETAMSAKRASLANKETSNEQVEVKKDKKAVIINIIKFVLGVAGIVIGAQLLVDNSQIVAKAIGISDGLIAITVVAIGTSLPELITTITSIVKKQGELGVGNIIGANIIDLVLILPICSFISKGNLEVAKQCAYIDLPALLVISSVAVIPTLINKKFTKVQGIILLILYIAYIVLAYLGQQGKLFY